MMKFNKISVGDKIPEVGTGDWFNSKPLKINDLINNGKLVLVDFWNQNSPNWLRTLPHLKSWWDLYSNHGLVIVGVHSAEFEFEALNENLVRAINYHGISWPVINDINYETWNKFNNSYWPRKYLTSPSGHIIFDQVGEGNYQTIEQLIRHELTKLGSKELKESISTDHHHKMDNFCYPQSSNVYLGNERGFYKNEVWDEPFLTNKQEFIDNPNNDLAGVSLQGLWQINKEFIAHNRKTNSMTDYLSLFFSGVEVNLIAGSKPPSETIKVLVELNGKPIPQDQLGRDIVLEYNKTYLIIQKPKTYQVITGSKQNIGANLRLYTDSINFNAYAFNFNGCPTSNIKLNKQRESFIIDFTTKNHTVSA